MHVRTNDTVKIIRGKDKGKVGKVLRVDTSANRVAVEGVNMVKRHTKAQGNVPGGIIAKEGTVAASNVMLMCTSCNKPRRSASRITGDTKERVCAKCKNPIEVTRPKASNA